jgi:hypothetical protein
MRVEMMSAAVSRRVAPRTPNAGDLSKRAPTSSGAFCLHVTSLPRRGSPTVAVGANPRKVPVVHRRARTLKGSTNARAG